MTQETLGYIELEWTCQRCGTKNPGTQKTCASCGAAMEQKDQFELPAQQALSFDQGSLEPPAAGPDVHCSYCGTRNPSGAQKCSQCGADLAGSAAREAGHVLGAYQAGPAPEISCPSCGAPNAPNAPRCQKCGGSLKKPVAPPAPSSPAKASGAPKVGLAIGGGAVAVVLCICVAIFGLLSMRTTDAQGVVQSVNWERTIEIMEQRPVTHEDWQDQIPSGAQKGTCERKFRRTQSEPAAGAEKVCGTPYVIDQGSGKGKVVQDCQYKVYDNWCKYTRNEWTAVDTLAARGADTNPRWPDVRLKAGQREGQRSEKYQVTFAANDKRYTYTPNSAEFPQFSPGSRWMLKVNALGGVTDVQPAK